MKEAVGGGWLFGFVAVFIVLFSAYLAISINYTKAFKVKNRIINLIEEKEGFKSSNKIKESGVDIEDVKNGNTTEDKIYVYLNEIGYKYNDVKCPEPFDSSDARIGGYCVKRYETNAGAYYKVVTFVSLELPLVWVKINVPITGETKVIYNDDSNL